MAIDFMNTEFTEFDHDEGLRKEREAFLEVCGSCLNFESFIAESGFCKIAECNCVCKNPKSMIDMWDKKCVEWVENPEINK